jgi:hypothetical protein
MRILVAGALLLLAACGAFVIGRVSAPEAQLPSQTRADEIIIRLGDQLRVPAIALFCTTDFEIDRAKLLCNRTGPRPRYQVVFERDRTKIGRLGFPGNQRVFAERR